MNLNPLNLAKALDKKFSDFSNSLPLSPEEYEKSLNQFNQLMSGTSPEQPEQVTKPKPPPGWTEESYKEIMKLQIDGSNYTIGVVGYPIINQMRDDAKRQEKAGQKGRG